MSSTFGKKIKKKSRSENLDFTQGRECNRLVSNRDQRLLTDAGETP